MSLTALSCPSVLGAAQAAADAVAALAQADVAAMSGHEAVELLQVVGPMLSQLQAVSLTASGVVRDSGVWGLDGSRSARAFLERATGASGGKVGSDLKLVERLTSMLPLTAQALRSGEISVEHALALSRGVCGTTKRVEALADPERGEAFLLAHAGLPVDQFKKFLASWAYRVDPDADDAKRAAMADDYHFDMAETMDGWHVQGFLTPEVGAGLAVALAAAAGPPASDDGRSAGRRRHDALATLTQMSLTCGGLGSLKGVRPQVVVHVPLETLLAAPGTPGLDPAVLQETGAPIPRSMLDRLVCDSEITRIVFGAKGQVLDVGRAQRTFTGPRRRALDARDGRCRAPGCDAPPRFCEGHHRVHFRDGGDTSVANGLLLCWAHHEWLHERGVSIELAPGGGLRFEGPDGRDYGTTYPQQLVMSA